MVKLDYIKILKKLIEIYAEQENVKLSRTFNSKKLILKKFNNSCTKELKNTDERRWEDGNKMHGRRAKRIIK